MLVKINGITRTYAPPVAVEVIEVQDLSLTTLGRIKRHVRQNYRAYLTAGYTFALIAHPSIALAAGSSGGIRLILLMQKASFWVGMGVTIWGIVEAQLDYPGWKSRVLKGVLGYIGILLVPLVFLELQNSLQVDVWGQIEEATKKPLPLQPQ